MEDPATVYSLCLVMHVEIYLNKQNAFNMLKKINVLYNFIRKKNT